MSDEYLILAWDISQILRIKMSSAFKWDFNVH